MSHELLRWWHVVAFALWFGTDLGVFTASLAATDSRLPVPVRQYALKLLLKLDLVPRFAMLLVVATGPLLAAGWLGTPVPTAAALGWVALVAAWAALVAHLHLAHGAAAPWATRFDYAVRLLLLGACIWLALQPTLHGNAPWLAVKLCLLAMAVACGLAVRHTLAPFIPAFARLVAQGSTPEVEAALRRSMNHSRGFVLLIYICVLAAAWLGVAKPAGS